ncbi:MAG: polyprenyl synthetase family protein [Thermodesulfobacteriota bacterium]|nr:polyprenyl synthetase family protein [Thermodesulfobacteriota bacterium]
MKIGEVFDLVSDDLKRVEAELSKNVMSQVPLIPKVGEYILTSGGKRFRPMILILSAKLCGYTGIQHIFIASIFEFIHTATLLHDDVIDKAEVRRGASSVNSLWGNETSVLMGDYFFSKSFSLMMRVGDLKVMKILSDATTCLAEGEIMELMKCKDPYITEEEYIFIIRMKTAVLISSACRVGAILGNAPLKEEKALERFGLNLGIAFQLIDDMLDYISTENEFGKTIGKDLCEGKITLPLIYTLEVCSPSDREEIIRVIETDEQKEQDVSAVINLVKYYKGPEHTYKRAEGYIKAAKDYMRCFDSFKEKDALLATADYVIERKW